MKTPQAPFSQECYVLASCTLRLTEERDAHSISRELVSMEPWLTLGYSRQALLGYLCRSDPALKRYTVWVANEVVGVVCVRLPWLRGPCMELLAVFAPAQGRGIGRQILFWIEGECRTLSHNLWTLTSSFNEVARRFYTNAGFSEAAVLPNLVADGFDEILLRKEVKGS